MKSPAFRHLPAVKEVIALIKEGFEKFDRNGTQPLISVLFSNKRLKKMGFRAKRHNGASCTPVYISRALGMVVKTPFICEDYVPRNRRRYLIPTVRLVPEDYRVPVFIQPLADISSSARSRAMKTLKDMFEDGQRRNIGCYNGRPVIFDW